MFGLYSRIAAALVIAALLTAGGWKAYSAGKKSVQAEWNAEKLVQATEAVLASEAARAKEQVLIAKTRKVDNDYQIEKKRRAADAVVSANRLRDLQTALSDVGSNAAAACRIDGDPRPGILAECVGVAVQLDEAVKSLAGQTRALQDYTREVRVTP